MSAQGESPGLDKRKASILRSIVREYVRTGQPIGSKMLVQRYRLKVSAATIRNDMGTLEELGYITQPYTSAGRIPTDRGYRWFVDNWPSAQWPDLPEQEQRVIDDLATTDFRGLDDALDSTSHILSGVTEATAVVVAPPAAKNLLSRLELLRRSDRKATLLLIAESGVVEQGLVEFAHNRTEAQVAALQEKLNRLLKGLAFEDLAPKVLGVERPSEDYKVVAAEMNRLMVANVGNRIFRGGTANIVSPDKFSDLATAHQVVGALEQVPVLSTLLEAVQSSATVLVFIGGEVPVEQMRSCAVVFAPYDVGSARQGTLGVVGPTRMDYPHTISAVEAAARSLSRLLDSAG